MHKVDSDGATEDNEFTNGNPLLGESRTVLEEKWMNMLQRELVLLAQQGGKTLSDTDDTQLAQSIVIHAATATALRACPVPIVPNTQTVMCFLRGLSSAGDGLAAIYYWVYNSSAADNGLTVLRPSSNPALGRWIRGDIAVATVASFATNAGQLGGVAANLYALLSDIVAIKVPPGAVFHFAMNTPPTGYLACDGSAVSRTTYAALFTAIGTTFGVGNGTTTFNLPDQKGQFIRGWNSTGSGLDAGRTFGSTQDHQLQTHTHKYTRTSPVINAGSGFKADDDDTQQSEIDTGSPDGANVGTETRPTNIAFLACIKT